MTAAIVGEWARLLLGSLVAAGLRDIVISPGSRSTPFAWAAANTPGVRCHSLWDERSAAFFALGLARVTGEPALVLCTSGSAAANYFPAVVEASLAHQPLLVMTADRPLELQEAAAPQTIDQVKLYGGFARAFFDLGVPDAAPSALAGVPRIAAQAVLATRSPRPGPVHLNARARKPLEPGPARTEHEHAVATEVDRLLAAVPRVFSPATGPSHAAVTALAERLVRAERALVVCGPLALERSNDAASIHALAEAWSLPVFAEATSQCRFGAAASSPFAVDGFDWMLRAENAHAALRPDFVLRFGAPTTSGAVERLFSAHAPSALAVVAEHGHPDPSNSASLVVQGAPGAVAEELRKTLQNRRPGASQSAYAARLRTANDATWAAVEDALLSGPPERSGEALAVRRAVEAIPPGGLLMLGNSLPVREVDAYVRASARELGVLSQRGTNGIDGLVSGAAGAALASKKPTLLLIGDVSFAHDLGGIAAVRRVETPLVLCVLDNGGGRIFDQLPVARLYGEQPALGELWLTPPRLAFEHAAELFGIPFASASTPEGLARELQAAFARPGATLLHVQLTGDGALKTLRAVEALLDARIASALGGGTP